MSNLWIGYFLGLGTIPCLFLLPVIYYTVKALYQSIQYSLYTYRCVRLANIYCPEYAESRLTTIKKVLTKGWPREFMEFFKSGNPYMTTVQDKACNFYEFRGWRKPCVVRREGISITPTQNTVPPPSSPPVPTVSATRAVNDSDGIEIFVD